MRINDLFYSLQGEGRNTGRAAAFVRFAGCNLKCDFCDTLFDTYTEMTPRQVVDALSQWPTRFVVLTGGEPTLQADSRLIDLLHSRGYEVAIETNGTRLPPPGIDWITVSPKGKTVVERCNELKLIFTSADKVPAVDIVADYYYLQPCDTGDPDKNAEILNDCIEYIKAHPKWRLSLQTHKLANFK